MYTHIHNKILCTAGNEIRQLGEAQMELEDILLSEISKKKVNI